VGLLSSAIAQPKTLELLLKTGMDPDLKTKHSTTLLFAASGNGLIKTIKTLLYFGANPCTQDKQGLYPKDHAFDWDGKNNDVFAKCEQALIEAMIKAGCYSK